MSSNKNELLLAQKIGFKTSSESAKLLKNKALKSKFLRSRLLKPLALVAGLGLLISGCAGNSGSASSDSGKKLNIFMVTHAAEGDTFWDIIRKGAEDAAKKNNISFDYQFSDDAGKQAQLLEQAIEKNPDGIAVTLAKADALKGAIKKAMDKKIPVVAFNAGQKEALDLGVITYYGQEELDAGKALGKRLAEDGYKNPLCIVQEQGHIGLNARCDGVKSQIPATEKLDTLGKDTAKYKSDVTAKLRANKDYDVVIGLGAPFTLLCGQAASDAGSSVKLASFDMSGELVQAIADGKVLYTVDQQPYLQGYGSVEQLVLYNKGLFKFGGGGPVATGPAIVDKTTAPSVVAYSKEKIR